MTAAGSPGPGRCGGCRHTAHRGPCKRKGPSGCVPFRSENGMAGHVCGARPPCPCPWRACSCGAPVAVAECADDPAMEETVERGSAGQPGGTLAVRKLPDGRLSARPVAAAGALRPGEWRGADHDAACPDAARRGVVDVTGAEGRRIPVPGAG